MTISIRRVARSREGMGRFGGGWQWAVGVRVGRRSAVIDLLTSSVRIDVW